MMDWHHFKGSGNISSALHHRNWFNPFSSKEDKIQLYFLLFIKDAFYRLPSKIDSLAHHECDLSAQTGIWILDLLQLSVSFNVQDGLRALVPRIVSSLALLCRLALEPLMNCSFLFYY